MPEPAFDVVCIGAATRDLVAAVERTPGPDERAPATDLREAGGGPAATAAVTLARLGARVALVARVGDDAAGGQIRDELAAEGVDVDAVEMVAGARSAVSLITADASAGTRAIVAYRGTVGAPVLGPRALARCAGARWIHVDHIGYAALPRSDRSGPQRRRVGLDAVSLDAGNPVPGLDLRRVVLFAPSEPFLRARYPDLGLEAAMRAAHGEGPAAVVVTRGADGASALSADGAFHVPAHPVNPYSTLGAGDVFHGALLAALLDGCPLEVAMRRANTAAALSCRALDGRSAIPRRVELDRALSESPGG